MHRIRMGGSGEVRLQFGFPLWSLLRRLACALRYLWALSLVLVLGCAATPAMSAGKPTPARSSGAQDTESEFHLAKGREYRIGPEDVLEISVWHEPDLHREVLVRPDGGISFPLAGDLQVAGLTTDQVQAEITARIKKYIPEAVVTVSAKKISGYTIFVIGKVNKPGQFVVGRYVDVMQALTLAGGLTPYANEDKIKVLRRNNGHDKVFPFHYSEVKSGDDLKQNILLQSGDVVVVP